MSARQAVATTWLHNTHPQIKYKTGEQHQKADFQTSVLELTSRITNISVDSRRL